MNLQHPDHILVFANIEFYWNVNPKLCKKEYLMEWNPKTLYKWILLGM
jgi:hypothetical protein